ncbi:HTH_48 domain-containing protein [Trichonephila clavipes]|nr:HTH_48 domain-containing protein [Trichonephila clavipes]
MRTIEIHRQLCQVYGPNIMSQWMVRRWCRQFSEDRQSVHNEERSGRPSLVNVDLVRQRVEIWLGVSCLIIPYSSDLAPNDFRVFLHLKKFMSAERLGNDEELKTSVKRWFHSPTAKFLDRVIHKLIPQFDKCLNSGGGYVEK